MYDTTTLPRPAANPNPVLVDIAGVRQAYHKGDKDLLVLAREFGARIVTADIFLERLV